MYGPVPASWVFSHSWARSSPTAFLATAVGLTAKRLPWACKVVQERVVGLLERDDERRRIRRLGLDDPLHHVGRPLGDFAATVETLGPRFGVGDRSVVELHVRLQRKRIRQLVRRYRPRLRQTRDDVRRAGLVAHESLVRRFHHLDALTL